MSALTDCYKTLTTPFGVKGPFYNPIIGHRGADYRRGGRDTVIAYESGVIEYIGRTGGLGPVLGMRLDRGGYAGWAHLYDIRVRVGQRVAAGDVLALVATYGDDTGSLWAGAHIHTTLSPVSAYNAAVGNMPLQDPAARIAAAVAGSSTAGGGSLTPIVIEEDDMEPDSFYFRDATDPGRAYGRFNASSGKARTITKEEWEMRKAVASTKDSTAPLPALTPVSSTWYDRILSL